MNGASGHETNPGLMLDALWGIVSGGVDEIGPFRKRFNIAEWEALMASDSAGLRVGWDIANILYQHDYDHTDVTEAMALREIRAVAAEWMTRNRGLAASIGHSR
ncbi:MAG TPA: hypothetical protein VD767_08265 [Thermomicrobiales bacterium]|nr:hypothetical protein [Thermomicrobiales bacterium]